MAQPNGEYPTFNYSEPGVPTKQANRTFWENWQKGQASRLGTYVTTDKNPVTGEQYDVYNRNGQEIHVVPGDNDFSFRIIYPGETSAQAKSRPAEYYPGGKELSDALSYITEHPNNPWNNQPWTDVNGKQITAGTATMPQLNMIAQKLQSFARPEMDQGAQNRIIQENLLARDMDSARRQLANLPSNELNALTLALKKYGDVTGLSSKDLANIPGVNADTIDKITRLQNTLESLGRRGLALPGIGGQQQAAGASELTGHLTDILSDFGILKLAGGGAGALGLAAGVKTVGALTQALINKDINLPKLRDGLQPETNNIRQSVVQEVANEQSSGHRMGNNVVDAAREAATNAYKEGVGAQDSPYTVKYSDDSGTSQTQPTQPGTTQAPKAQPVDGTVKRAEPVTKAPIGGSGQMSDQETMARAQIVNQLKQQPGREHEAIDLNSPEVTNIYNSQSGIKTAQLPPDEPTGSEGPGITKPQPTGPISAPIAATPAATPSPDTSQIFTATQAGVQPGTDIQNITTNRAAQVAKPWKPEQSQVNQTIDQAVNAVTGAMTKGWGPNPTLKAPIAATPAVTPKAATDAQSAIQNVITQRAADVANQPQTTENIEQQAPGVLRRLVFPYGVPGVSTPTYEEERQFQEQQDKEQQERARKQLEGTIPQDAAVGAPLGAPNDAPGVARLHQQEHVDALEPGTPFYWRDHPGAYVRV